MNVGERERERGEGGREGGRMASSSSRSANRKYEVKTMLPRQQTARKKIREGSCRRNNAGGGVPQKHYGSKGCPLHSHREGH